ncbi:MAG: type II toxin-antitoxin system HicB family antitoxin [Chromatiales bacterium]
MFEKINLQRDDGKAKPYQVRQVRAVILKIRFSEERVMHKYETIIYWSDEDQVFVAEVPELPGCTAHGATQEEALAHTKEAIKLWIDTAREFGDPIPEPKGRRLMYA